MKGKKHKNHELQKLKPCACMCMRVCVCARVWCVWVFFDCIPNTSFSNPHDGTKVNQPSTGQKTHTPHDLIRNDQNMQWSKVKSWNLKKWGNIQCQKKYRNFSERMFGIFLWLQRKVAFIKVKIEWSIMDMYKWLSIYPLWWGMVSHPPLNKISTIPCGKIWWSYTLGSSPSTFHTFQPLNFPM